jgi:membrane protein implicated in regulation of membrane protease activity
MLAGGEVGVVSVEVRQTQGVDVGATDDDDERLIGGLGYVTVRIPGGAQPGEVQVELNGGSESFIAYADRTVQRGEQVVVIGRRPGRGVVVTQIEGWS